MTATPSGIATSLAGTRGSLAVPTLRVLTYPGEASWSQRLHREQLALPEVDPLARQLEHFLAVIRREVTPLVTVRDAARTLAVTLAVAEAAHTGRRVTLH